MAMTTASICTGHSFTRQALMVSEGVPVNPAISNLFSSKRYPFNILDWGTGLEPVVLASRFTAFASFTEGRFNTISLVTKRFLAVWEEAPRPMIQRHPNQKIEDIGARLSVPLGFFVLISTTGVPKYRMEG